MPRSPRPEGSSLPLEELQRILAFGPDAAPFEERFERLQILRHTARDRGRAIDTTLLRELDHRQQSLLRVTEIADEYRTLLEKCNALPWFPATVLRIGDPTLEPRAEVSCGGTRRVVEIGPDLHPESLARGDEVFLNGDLNFIVAKSLEASRRPGDTAIFERVIDEERVLLRWRDEEIAVRPAATLPITTLASGDQVRWDRQSGMAFEKIERPRNLKYFLEEAPKIGRDQIGGHEEIVDRVLMAVTMILHAPDIAREYKVDNRQSILLIGASGVGKTTLARICASEIARLTGTACRIAVVKPSEWESKWVGETEENIRACFASLREVAATEGHALLFLDEIESIGRIRGSAGGYHSDSALAALLAELDGFARQDGVAVIAATNRKDLVDPALLERLSEIEITIPRPDRVAAEAIFHIHLPEDVPYAGGTGTRREMIETALTSFYSPNADNDLCVLKLRDGSERSVVARDLVSGRVFEQVCRAVCRTASERQFLYDDRGLRLSDMETAVAERIEQLATTLDPRNAHTYLPDLPQDLDVTSVRPVRRRVSRPHRYLNAA